MQGIFYALAAAILFGVSTPLAKLLIGDIHPLVLAALLYIGSGVGLALVLALRNGMRSNPESPESIVRLSRADWPTFALAVMLGGVIAPVLLLFGLQRTTASVSSLMLNMESVFTVMLAWFIFREHVDRRIMLGMASIVIGSLLLSWMPGQHNPFSLGAVLIAGACLCWAADNNFTRKVSANDAVVIACLKGLIAGSINLIMAWIFNLSVPWFSLDAVGAMMVGFLGYGVSLSLFVLALRHLGAARTSAYFSTGPFIGAGVALLIQHESLSIPLTAASTLMGVGVWLHLTERHAHEHSHDELDHEHSHVHDEHHHHAHDFSWDGKEPHTHRHQHAAMTHSHVHYPDIHHQHKH